MRTDITMEDLSQQVQEIVPKFEPLETILIEAEPFTCVSEPFAELPESEMISICLPEKPLFEEEFEESADFYEPPSN